MESESARAAGSQAVTDQTLTSPTPRLLALPPSHPLPPPPPPPPQASLLALFEFLYTGGVRSLPPDVAMEAMAVAQYTAVDGLKALCESSLISVVDASNVTGLLLAAQKNGAGELKRFCMEFCFKHHGQVRPPRGGGGRGASGGGKRRVVPPPPTESRAHTDADAVSSPPRLIAPHSTPPRRRSTCRRCSRSRCCWWRSPMSPCAGRGPTAVAEAAAVSVGRRRRRHPPAHTHARTRHPPAPPALESPTRRRHVTHVRSIDCARTHLHSPQPPHGTCTAHSAALTGRGRVRLSQPSHAHPRGTHGARPPPPNSSNDVSCGLWLRLGCG
jgi:hypothetical protein